MDELRIIDKDKQCVEI